MCGYVPAGTAAATTTRPRAVRTPSPTTSVAVVAPNASDVAPAAAAATTAAAAAPAAPLVGAVTATPPAIAVGVVPAAQVTRALAGGLRSRPWLQEIPYSPCGPVRDGTRSCGWGRKGCCSARVRHLLLRLRRARLHAVIFASSSSCRLPRIFRLLLLFLASCRVRHRRRRRRRRCSRGRWKLRRCLRAPVFHPLEELLKPQIIIVVVNRCLRVLLVYFGIF